MTTGFTHELSIEGKTNVWLTPKSIIEALGPFDLDPCAAPIPRPWSTADSHYIESQDGLTQPWHGFVWLNPPYGRETGKWLNRLAAHNHGIALIFARTDTQWFHKIAYRCHSIFLPIGRIKFCLRDGTSMDQASAPSMFLCFGAEATERVQKSDLKGLVLRL